MDNDEEESFLKKGVFGITKKTRSGKIFGLDQTPTSSRLLNNSPESDSELNFEENLIEGGLEKEDLNIESGTAEQELETMAEFNRNEFMSSIPEFEENSQELPRFISLVEFMLSELTVAGQQMLYRNLRYKLKSKAFEIYEEVLDNTWEGLKTRLEQHFLVQKSMIALQNEMQQMYQGRNENVKTFADKIKTKLNELKHCTSYNYAEVAVRNGFNSEHKKLALKAFRNGLSYPIRNIIKAGRDRSLDEAVSAALEEEADLPKRDSERKVVNSGFVPNDQMRQGNERPMPKFRTPQFYCQRCHSRSHNINDCFARLTVEGTPLLAIKNERQINTVEQKFEDDYNSKN